MFWLIKLKLLCISYKRHFPAAVFLAFCLIRKLSGLLCLWHLWIWRQLKENWLAYRPPHPPLTYLLPFPVAFIIDRVLIFIASVHWIKQNQQLLLLEGRRVAVTLNQWPLTYPWSHSLCDLDMRTTYSGRACEPCGGWGQRNRRATRGRGQLAASQAGEGMGEILLQSFKVSTQPWEQGSFPVTTLLGCVGED